MRPYECVFVNVCVRVWGGCSEKKFDWQTLSGGPEGLRSHCKRFIGKMHPRMHLGGSCPRAIIEWPLRARLLLTFPPNKLTSLSSEEVGPFSSHIYTEGSDTVSDLKQRRRAPSPGGDDCGRFGISFLSMSYHSSLSQDAPVHTLVQLKAGLLNVVRQRPSEVIEVYRLMCK